MGLKILWKIRLTNKSTLLIIQAYKGLSYIKEILGHRSSKTTEIYTHVTTKSLGKIVSQIDTINLNKGVIDDNICQVKGLLAIPPEVKYLYQVLISFQNGSISAPQVLI
jgi:hypothetical protein